MIIWITGQHNAGKTTLALALAALLELRNRYIVQLDGDAWRTMTRNLDYSEEGRRRNINQAMRVASVLDDDKTVVICSFISPYRDMREQLKSVSNCLEVYVYTGSRRTNSPRKLVDGYEPPTHDMIEVPTDEFGITYRRAIELIVDKALEATLQRDAIFERGGGI
jgi:energy-coupling factor transporter ATP-binding protein EcfA2